ncbi:NAD-dependent epimerase/dehydratase family protein [bacterium]|nr:MAG: NAD-dependent epimerase/dehydratase family protein [bacterium]
MQVFLTGATGYIGSAVAAALLRAGHDVRGLARSRAKAAELQAAGVAAVLGELSNPGTYAQAAGACDAIVHAGFETGPRAAEVDRLALEALLEAAQVSGRPKSLVYTSGVWVMGRHHGAPGTEEDPPAPLPIVSWRPAVETLALAAGGGRLATAVVRPGCVYGGCGGLYGRMLQAAVEEHEVVLTGAGRNAWAAVYLDDLADLYVRLVERHPDGIFHATDGSADPLAEVAEAFLEAAGGGALVLRPLADALREDGPFAEGLALDQRVSSEKARRELGWRPSLSSPANHAPALLALWRAKAGPLSVS